MPKVLRRFEKLKPLEPELVRPLDADHPAVVAGRTLFPTTVVAADEAPRVLVSGQNNPKLGDRVAKGEWAGMPIFHLALEERATCPRSCDHWRSCYGNAMPQARRHAHGAALIDVLGTELHGLSKLHWEGFVVRLHTLGDFYSVDYVAKWAAWVRKYPRLRVFGYTAHPPDSEIGAAIARVREAYPTRFAIRFSGIETATLWRKPEAAVVPEGIVCPAQTGATACCGTCGLCWSPNARDKIIVFVAHGKKAGNKKPQSEKMGRTTPAERRQIILDLVRSVGGQVSNRDICDRLGLSSPASASALVKSMVDDGLITIRLYGRSKRVIDIIGEGKSAKPQQPCRPAPPRPRPKPVPEIDDASLSDGPTLMELKVRDCRFPLGDPHEPGFHFCGRERANHAVSYCPAHLRRCYQTAPSREKRPKKSRVAWGL